MENADLTAGHLEWASEKAEPPRPDAAGDLLIARFGRHPARSRCSVSVPQLRRLSRPEPASRGALTTCAGAWASATGSPIRALRVNP